MYIINAIRENQYIKKIQNFFGFDKALLYTISLRGFSTFRALLTSFLILTLLSISEQGYWFTFQSLGALTVFAELGFLAIIAQFISHEYAHLKLNRLGRISGPPEQIEKFVSLIRFAYKVFFIITPIAFLILTTIGYFVLNKSEASSFVIINWILYSFTGAIMLIVSLTGSVLQGCDRVAEYQKAFLQASVISCGFMWATMLLGFSLLGIIVGSTINILVVLYVFYIKYPLLWKTILKLKPKQNYKWFSQTWALQVKYALSWIAGYFIFQFMTPATLYYMGSPAAGRLGMSLAIINTLQSVSMAWGFTKIPQFNILVSQKKREELDKTFRTMQIQSMSVFSVCALGLVALYHFVFPLVHWTDRLVSIQELILLIGCVCCNLIIGNWAFYLRAHKEEPYMLLSVLNGILTGLFVWASLVYFKSTFYAILSYFLAQFIIMIPAYLVFRKKKAEYAVVWSA